MFINREVMVGIWSDLRGMFDSKGLDTCATRARLLCGWQAWRLVVGAPDVGTLM